MQYVGDLNMVRAEPVGVITNIVLVEYQELTSKVSGTGSSGLLLKQLHAHSS